MNALKRHRFALAFIFAAATVLFIAPLIRQEVFVLRDHFDYFQPLRWFTAEELKAGRLPLWNPYSASGEPWLANPQTGVFYPPAWLFVVLPFATAYTLFLLLHLVILGWGAYLLFARRASPGAAMVGAVALIFSGPVLSLLDISGAFATLAWVPFALWCAAVGAWRRGALALALAFLAGEPFFAALAAAMYVITAGATRPKGGRVMPIVLAGVCAFGISAVQLLPFLEYVRLSDRAGAMDAADVFRESMPLRDWPRIVVPPALDESAIDPSLGQHFIPVIYIGIAVAVLALVGLTTIRTRREVVGWIAMLGFAVMVSAGPLFLAKLPVILFRYPARLVPFAALAIAGLAVAGWERLRVDKRWLDLIIVLIVIADLVPRSLPLLRTAPFQRDVVPYDAAIGAGTKFLRVGEADARHRVAWISGYLNLYDRRFDAFTAAPLISARYAQLHRALLEERSRERLAKTGIGYVLTRHDLPDPFRPVSRAGGVIVYGTGEAWPMAVYVGDASRTVAPAEWSLDTSHARLIVDAPEDGRLVLLQQWWPGWRVEVDGRKASPIPVDGIFRGVELPRGRHEVVWTYLPSSLVLGAACSLATLAAMQISAFVKRSRDRKS